MPNPTVDPQDPVLLNAARSLAMARDRYEQENPGKSIPMAVEDAKMRELTGGKYGRSDADTLMRGFDTSNNASNLLRAGSQGATLDFADELAGMGKQGETERIRLANTLYDQLHPGPSFVAQLAGGLAIPGLGMLGTLTKSLSTPAKIAANAVIGGGVTAGQIAGTAEGGVGDRVAAVKAQPGQMLLGTVVGGAMPAAERLDETIRRLGIFAPKTRALGQAAEAATGEGGVSALANDYRDLQASGQGRDASVIDLGQNGRMGQLGAQAAGNNEEVLSTLAALKRSREQLIPGETMATVDRAAASAMPEAAPAPTPEQATGPSAYRPPPPPQSIADAVGGRPSFAPGQAAPRASDVAGVQSVGGPISETIPPEAAGRMADILKRIQTSPFNPLRYLEAVTGNPHGETMAKTLDAERHAATDEGYAAWRAANPSVDVTGPGGVKISDLEKMPSAGWQQRNPAKEAYASAIKNGWVPKGPDDVIPGTGSGGGLQGVMDMYKEVTGSAPKFQHWPPSADELFRLKQAMDHKITSMKNSPSSPSLTQQYDWHNLKEVRDALDSEMRGMWDQYNQLQNTSAGYFQKMDAARNGAEGWHQSPQEFSAALADSPHPDLYKKGALGEWLNELRGAPSRAGETVAQRIVNLTEAERTKLSQIMSPEDLRKIQRTVQSQTGVANVAEKPLAKAGATAWNEQLANREASRQAAQEDVAAEMARSWKQTVEGRVAQAQGLDPQSAELRGIKDWKSNGPPDQETLKAMSPTTRHGYQSGILKAFVAEVRSGTKSGSEMAAKFANPDAATYDKLVLAFGGKGPADALLLRLRGQARLQGSIKIPATAIDAAGEHLPAAAMSATFTAKKGIWNALMAYRNKGTAAELERILTASGGDVPKTLQAIQSEVNRRGPQAIKFPGLFAPVAVAHATTDPTSPLFLPPPQP